MSEAAYQVVLPVFEGPLDLLLHLIEREELDITQVSLAQVAQQFLDYVTLVEVRDPDRLADFLVVAAKLLLIKSRALLPRPPAAALPAEEDIGRDLVQQLVEYRRFKQAAGWLGALQALGLQSYVRVSDEPDIPQRPDLTGVTLDSLLAAVREALEIRPLEPLANGTLPPLVVTVAEQIERIEGELARSGRVSFAAFLREATGRLEIVVTLLAVLEMVKRGQIAVRQDVAFGDISITSLPSSEA
jgi:segregation and condensation protein A